MGHNSKTLNVTKLRNSKSDKTEKTKNITKLKKSQIANKTNQTQNQNCEQLKNSNYVKNQKIKLGQIPKT